MILEREGGMTEEQLPISKRVGGEVMNGEKKAFCERRGGGGEKGGREQKTDLRNQKKGKTSP